MPSLVDYDRNFLEKSWEWLNDPEIKALTMTPDFTREDQLHFYNSLHLKKNYWIKGIMEDGSLIGAMGLKNIDTKKSEAEYWGYIGEKAYWGKGIGKFMISEAVFNARQMMLDHLYLKVDPKNNIAKKLYLGAGFILVKTGNVELYKITL
jgi:RimJ/RimL family protein N-acetyltransferase